jgi:predicted nucleotidyltransferase
MKSPNLCYDAGALRRFCRERGIARLELFGSVLRDDFRPDSDVDLLCTLKPEHHCTLLGWADMKLRLEEIFGRPVDLVSRWAIERSRNPYRRNAILSATEPLYVEG